MAEAPQLLKAGALLTGLEEAGESPTPPETRAGSDGPGMVDAEDGQVPRIDAFTRSPN